MKKSKSPIKSTKSRKSKSPIKSIKSKSKSPIKSKSKSKSPIKSIKSPIKSIKSKSKSPISNESFIECIQRVKGNLKGNPEKLMDCLYTMINSRKNVDKFEHPLVNKNNLYKSVVVYCSTKLTNDDINTIKNSIKPYKHTGKHDTVKQFLKDVKFEKFG